MHGLVCSFQPKDNDTPSYGFFAETHGGAPTGWEKDSVYPADDEIAERLAPVDMTETRDTRTIIGIFFGVWLGSP